MPIRKPSYRKARQTEYWLQPVSRMPLRVTGRGRGPVPGLSQRFRESAMRFDKADYGEVEWRDATGSNEACECGRVCIRRLPGCMGPSSGHTSGSSRSLNVRRAGRTRARHRRQTPRHRQKRHHPPAGRHGCSAEHPHRQALLHDNRHHGCVATEYSAKRPLCHPHSVCSFRARIAGGRSECNQPRSVRELRVNSGFAASRNRSATGAAKRAPRY